MDAKKRDELLIRLDERSINTWTILAKVETHLEKLNDSVANAKIRISVNRRWLGAITSATIALLTMKMMGIF